MHIRLIHDRWLALVLLISVSLALAGAIVLAPVPLSLDGPSHVYGAVVMRHLASGDPLFSRYFQFNSLLTPNWLASLLLALAVIPASMQWNIGLMTGVAVGLMVAALHFQVRRASRQRRGWEQNVLILVTLVPLALSAFLFAGFWGFLFSAALCFFAVGMSSGACGASARLLVLVLVLLAYWAHPIPVVLTAFFPAGGYVAALVRSVRSGTGGVAHLTAGFLIRIFPWLVAVALIARFTMTLVHLGSGQRIDEGQPIGTRIISLLRPDAISPSWNVSALYILLAATLVTGVVLSKSAMSSFRLEVAVFTVVVLAAYLVVPDRIGNGAFISRRVLLILLCSVAVLALSSDLSFDSRYLRLCASIAALITMVVCAEYMRDSWRLAPAVRELRNAMARVQPRSTILLLSYRLTPGCAGPPLLEAVRPERHWSLFGAMQGDLLVLNDYEPGSENFPVDYRDRRFASIENEFDFSPRVFSAWGSALDNAKDVAYVVSWGVPSGTSRNCGAWVEAPIEENLKRAYRMEAEARQTSRVQVWRRL